MNEYLYDFVATRNTSASATLGKFTLGILRCRTDQLSRLFLPADVRLWKLLPSGMYSGGSLSSFKSVPNNLCLMRA